LGDKDQIRFSRQRSDQIVHYHVSRLLYIKNLTDLQVAKTNRGRSVSPREDKYYKLKKKRFKKRDQQSNSFSKKKREMSKYNKVSH